MRGTEVLTNLRLLDWWACRRANYSDVVVYERLLKYQVRKLVFCAKLK